MIQGKGSTDVYFLVRTDVAQVCVAAPWVGTALVLCFVAHQDASHVALHGHVSQASIGDVTQSRVRVLGFHFGSEHAVGIVNIGSRELSLPINQVTRWIDHGRGIHATPPTTNDFVLARQEDCGG